MSGLRKLDLTKERDRELALQWLETIYWQQCLSGSSENEDNVEYDISADDDDEEID